MADDAPTPPRDPDEAEPTDPSEVVPTDPSEVVPPTPFEAEAWPWASEPLPGHGSRDDQVWAVSTHLSIFAFGIAFPLAVVLFKGHRSPYVCHQAVEALNFHTTVLLAVLFCSVTSVFLVGAFLLPVVLAVAAVLAVRAALQARRGAWHRYPLTLRFVS
jgi:uncharacterized Tic20 family protein